LYLGEDKISLSAQTGIDKTTQLENVGDSWIKADLVGYTSTICVGVDFTPDTPHFHKFVGIYTGDKGTNSDLFV